MDFNTLSRRGLQFLCKKNKIPANITNVAMADALNSLQHVEGIEELLNHQSPEKSIAGSSPPRSMCRQSTRRSTMKEIPKTPSVQSSRRRAPIGAASARQKATESVACSTRRSVRLAEKKLAELSLNQKGKYEAIKIGDFSKEMNQCLDDAHAHENISSAGTDDDKRVVSKEGSEKIEDLGFVTDQHLNEVLENAKQSKDDNEEKKVMEVGSEMSCVMGMIVEESIGEEIMGVDLEIKPEVANEATNECAIMSSGDEMKHMKKIDCDKFPVTMDESSTFNSGDIVPLSEETENNSLCYMDSTTKDSDGVFKEPDSDEKILEELEENSENIASDQSEEHDDRFTDITMSSESSPVVNLLINDQITSSTMKESPKSLVTCTRLVSNEELNGKIPFSKWTFDPVIGHIPRPTSLTPKIKELKGDNKENINNSMKMKETSDENKPSTPLDMKSLRKLSTMLKNKLSVKSSLSNNEARPALKVLPVNKDRD